MDFKLFALCSQQWNHKLLVHLVQSKNCQLHQSGNAATIFLDGIHLIPFLISPEKNENLRIHDMFQEAGHYYAATAYLIDSPVSPFCINAKYQVDI